MKQVILLFLTLLFLTTIPLAQNNQKDSFLIRGKLLGNYHGFIYLKYENKAGVKIKDSFLISKENFYFKGQVNCYTEDAYLRLSSTSLRFDEPNSTRVYLENSEIHITIRYNDFKSIKISGVSTKNELEDFLIKKKKIYDTKIEYYEKLSSKSLGVNKKYYDTKIDYYIGKSIESNLKYSRRHPNSNASAFLINRGKGRISDDALRQAYFLLSKKQQYSYYGNKILMELNVRDSINNQIGIKAPLFSALDINKKYIKLDSIIKGNYVLLDFWASWCVPCRESNPHLLTLYQKYKERGFQIIGIADDVGDEAKWEKAIFDDKINIWPHILRTIDQKEINRKGADISDMFIIRFLPTKILIDKDGVIIGRYNSEDNLKLEKKLNEIFHF